MLLLNQDVAVAVGLMANAFTFQYASIKPYRKGTEYGSARLFTFQYASIKPGIEIIATNESKIIYISICFY